MESVSHFRSTPLICTNLLYDYNINSDVYVIIVYAVLRSETGRVPDGRRFNEDITETNQDTSDMESILVRTT